MEPEQQIEEQDLEAAVSEQAEGTQEDHQDGQKMVPLSAMIATRRKLQDAEMRAAKAEAASQVYQQHLSSINDPKEPEEDDSSTIVERKDLRETMGHTKRDILETLYQDMNPEAVQKINKYLKPI